MAHSTRERIERVMAGIREMYADKYISITPSNLEEYAEATNEQLSSSSHGANHLEMRRADNLQLPHSELHSQGPVARHMDANRRGRPTAYPSAARIRQDLAGRYSELSAIPPTPTESPSASTDTLLHLQNRPAIPRVDRSRTRHGQQQSQYLSIRRSRYPTRSSMAWSTRRFSITPSDLIYPPPAMVIDGPGRCSATSRTLGLTARGDSGKSTEEPWDIEASAIAGPDLNSANPPDGGRLAWAIAWSGFLVTFNCWGLNTAFGVFQAYYSFYLLHNEPADKIAWIGSVQLFMMFFLGTPVGLGMDHGWFRIFFNGGSALLVLSVFATSFCTEWWQLFLVQGVLTGLAMGSTFCSGVVVLMSYFNKNIGLATAIGAAGSSLGAVVYSLMFQHLIEPHGFAWTMRNMGFVVLGTMIPPTLIVRPRKAARRRKQVLKWQAFKDGPYWTMAIGLFFAFWGVFFGFYYMVSYGVSIGLSGVDAINLLIAMCAANLPGRLLPGVISDRCIGPLSTIVPSCVFSAAVVLLWAFTKTKSALFVVAAFYGFTVAGIQSLYAPTIHSFAHKDPESMGQKVGTVFTVISIACLTGAPIGGALLGRDNGDYRGAQGFAGGCLVVGGMLLLFARILKVGWSAQRA